MPFGSLACPIRMELGLPHYPALRKKRFDAPLLHADFRGGTRGYFSPECAAAFEQIKSADEEDAAPMLCAAESDQWAWAIITARLFKPHIQVSQHQPGEQVGTMFVQYIAEEEPEVTELEWIGRLRTWDASRTCQWLNEDLGHLKFVKSFVAAFDKGGSGAGNILANILSATGVKAEGCMERRFSGGTKFKVPYTACLRKIRQELGGGMAIAMPEGQRFRTLLRLL